MKSPAAMIFLFLSIVVAALIVSRMIAKGKYLRTEKAAAEDIHGVFSLFLYGANDPKQVAVLDIEGDAYDFTIDDSSRNYTVTREVSAEQSVAGAVAFLDTENHRIAKILHKGTVVGYEIRPVFQTVRFGSPDILDVDYRLENRAVHVSVAIKTSLKRNYERDLYGGE